MSAIEIIDGPTEGEKFTARTFLDYMRKSSPHWWKEGQASTNCDWVFRGHWDESWKLIPTAARTNFEGVSDFKIVVESVRDAMNAESAEWRNLDANTQDQLARRWAHMRCATSFIQLARSLNIIDFDVPDLTRGLASWISETGSRPDELIDIVFLRGPFGYPRATDPSIALAQHHGIPTFLLDWTEAPLTACYFASNRPKGADAKQGAAIWCLNIPQLKQDDEKIRRLVNHTVLNKMGALRIGVSSPAKKGNSYLSSQSGVLTYIHGDHEFWKKLDEYPALEWGLNNASLERFDEVYDERNFREKVKHQPLLQPEGIAKARDWLGQREPVLKKVVLSAEELPAFQQLLLREGVSKAHMMPSLDNVASTAMASLIT